MLEFSDSIYLFNSKNPKNHCNLRFLIPICNGDIGVQIHDEENFDRSCHVIFHR